MMIYVHQKMPFVQLFTQDLYYKGCLEMVRTITWHIAAFQMSFWKNTSRIQWAYSNEIQHLT